MLEHKINKHSQASWHVFGLRVQHSNRAVIIALNIPLLQHLHYLASRQRILHHKIMENAEAEVILHPSETQLRLVHRITATNRHCVCFTAVGKRPDMIFIGFREVETIMLC